MAANRPPFLFLPLGIESASTVKLLKSAVPKRDTFHEQGIRLHQELRHHEKAMNWLSEQRSPTRFIDYKKASVAEAIWRTGMP